MKEAAVLLEFENRKEFRMWLDKNSKTSEGIWLLLKKGNKTFSANDALEEAICFGWIDGLIKTIDERSYKKYFAKRKDTENWSEKNIKIYAKLDKGGLITQAGKDAYKVKTKINVNTQNDINSIRIDALKKAIMTDEKVLKLFNELSPSRQKQLAGFYCDAKSEATRNKRIGKIIEALISGNKGMLY